MKAIILAAGRGSRMKNLTDECPKCLVKVQGETLLEWQLAALKSAGIKEIAIVTGYRHQLLKRPDLKEFHNPRWSDTNMVASLACADEWLSKEPCVVSYSDIFYEVGAVQLLMSSNASLAITYDPDWLPLWQKRFEDPLSDAETFRIRADGTLLEIGQKATSIEQIQGQYMGLLRFTPSAWSVATKIRDRESELERDKMQMTGLLQKVIDVGEISVLAHAYKGRWGEVDSVEDLAVYN